MYFFLRCRQGFYQFHIKLKPHAQIQRTIGVIIFNEIPGILFLSVHHVGGMGILFMLIQHGYVIPGFLDFRPERNYFLSDSFCIPANHGNRFGMKNGQLIV
jgi:hypothetical protein